MTSRFVERIKWNKSRWNSVDRWLANVFLSVWLTTGKISGYHWGSYLCGESIGVGWGGRWQKELNTGESIQVGKPLSQPFVSSLANVPSSGCHFLPAQAIPGERLFPWQHFIPSKRSRKSPSFFLSPIKDSVGRQRQQLLFSLSQEAAGWHRKERGGTQKPWVKVLLCAADILILSCRRQSQNVHVSCLVPVSLVWRQLRRLSPHIST